MGVSGFILAMGTQYRGNNILCRVAEPKVLRPCPSINVETFIPSIDLTILVSEVCLNDSEKTLQRKYLDYLLIDSVMVLAKGLKSGMVNHC